MSSRTERPAALALIAVWLACRSSRDMVTDPPTPSEPPSAHGDAAAPPAAPAVDLGATLAPIAFAPGRYAHVVERSLQGTHALQRLRESSAASLVLELGGDGTATACRGWRYAFTNDGPDVHTQDRFNDQQGYRGTYAVRDGAADVSLTADDAVCPRRRESAMVLERATAIRLRCVLATPRAQAGLTGPVLACRWFDPTTDEAHAHLAPGVGPDGWIVLGSGNGLRVKITGQPPGSRIGAPTTVTAEPAPEPLGFDAWTTSF